MPFPQTADPTTARFLERPVRQLMTPGVIALPDDASVRMAFKALVTHRVHAVLVVACADRRPRGWVSARSLMPFLLRDDDLLHVSHAIDEPPVTIAPSASIGEALALLSEPGTTHLVVARERDAHPEGVISALDLMAVGVR